jgi:hypothetical protein
VDDRNRLQDESVAKKWSERHGCANYNTNTLTQKSP